jgi:hypothetical protein
LSLIGVVKSPFAGTRLSCRDDADFFFAMMLLACVDYQEDRDAAGGADCVPALFFVNHTIPVRCDGSSKTRAAISKEMPCFRRFVRFFFSSQTKTTCIYRIVAYPGFVTGGAGVQEFIERPTPCAQGNAGGLFNPFHFNDIHNHISELAGSRLITEYPQNAPIFIWRPTSFPTSKTGFRPYASNTLWPCFGPGRLVIMGLPQFGHQTTVSGTRALCSDQHMDGPSCFGPATVKLYEAGRCSTKRWRLHLRFPG